MPFKSSCPFCSQAFRLADELLGKEVHCPKCQADFVAYGNQPSGEPAVQVKPTEPAAGKGAPTIKASAAKGVSPAAGGPKINIRTSERKDKIPSWVVLVGGVLLAILVLGGGIMLVLPGGESTSQVAQASAKRLERPPIVIPPAPPPQPKAVPIVIGEPQPEPTPTDAPPDSTATTANVPEQSAEPPKQPEPPPTTTAAAPAELPADEPVLEHIKMLDLFANDLLYDAERKLIYASVSALDPQWANTIVALEPANLAIRWAIPVGYDPVAMALSDDGSVLWVGLHGVPGIQRVDLERRTTGPILQLDQAPPAPIYMMYVVPGTTESLVISFNAKSLLPKEYSAAVYDQGIRRPEVVRGITGRLAWSEDHQSLYSFSDWNSLERKVFRLAVKPEGLVEDGSFKAANLDVDVGIVSVDGKLFSTDGSIYQADSGDQMATLALTGMNMMHMYVPGSTVHDLHMLGAVAANPSRHRAYFLRAADMEVTGYDTENHGEAAHYVLKDKLGEPGPVPEEFLVNPQKYGEYLDRIGKGSLVVAGDDRLALRGDAKVVLLTLRNPDSPASPNTPVPPSTLASIEPSPVPSSDPPPASPLPKDLQEQPIKSVPVPGLSLAYDPGRSLIYVAVSGSPDKNLKDGIAAVDVVTGDVVWSLEMMAAPNAVALSDDGSTLWVAMKEKGAIQSVNVEERKLQRLYALDKVDGKPVFAESLAVVPGSTNMVLVSMRVQPDARQNKPHGIGLYVDGSRHGPFIAPEGGQAAFGDDPSVLYVARKLGPDHALVRFTVNSVGIKEDATINPKLTQGDQYVNRLGYVDGHIITQYGDCVSAADGKVEGQFPSKGLFAVNPELKQAVYMDGNSLLSLYACDVDTRKLASFCRLAQPPGTKATGYAAMPGMDPGQTFSQQARRLIPMGKDGMALCTGSYVMIVPAARFEAAKE